LLYSSEDFPWVVSASLAAAVIIGIMIWFGRNDEIGPVLAPDHPCFEMADDLDLNKPDPLQVIRMPKGHNGAYTSSAYSEYMWRDASSKFLVICSVDRGAVFRFSVDGKGVFHKD
jgi:hypothetical protein